MIQNNKPMKQNVLRDELPHSVMKILEQKLRIICDICNQQVIEPKICPSCSEIFCRQCLIKYHQGHRNCPMCHEKFSLNQFLDCDCHSFIDYFRQQLRQFQMVMKGSEKKIGGHEGFQLPKQNQEEQKRCEIHDIAMRYYCETCNTPVCSDCGMMSSQHTNHKFTRLNDVYSRYRSILTTQLSNLNRKILSSQQCCLLTKKKLQKLQLQYMHIKRYTQQYYLLLVERFEEQITSKTMLLKQIQQKNSKDVEFYELCRDGICQEMERKNKMELIQETDKILSSFTINPCEPCQPFVIEETLETIKELQPEYTNFQFTLNNFSTLTSSIVYSEAFILNGVEWRLKIYPKGNGVAKNKYISVFVEMSKAQRNQKKYEYKIELVNLQVNGQNIRREYCSAFDVGECWGYNQFVLLEELHAGFLLEDRLYFVMGIRNTDYRTLSQDQSNYIARLSQEVKLKELQRENLIQETNIIDDMDQSQSYTSIVYHNDTKFLKFLDSSSYSEEKIVAKKSKENKEKKKILQKQQKQGENQKREVKNQKYPKNIHDRQLQNLDYLTHGSSPQSRNAQIATNNFSSRENKKQEQIHENKIIKKKPQRNQFVLTENQQFILTQEDIIMQHANYLSLSSPQKKVKMKEDMIKTKKKRATQEQFKQKSHISTGNKYISLKELKQEKLNTNSQHRNTITYEIKPQKKEDSHENSSIDRQEETNFKKYEFYFNQSKKNSNKVLQKQPQDNGMSNNQFNFIQMSKKYKTQVKDQKKTSPNVHVKKIEQSKQQIESQQLIHSYGKIEESKINSTKIKQKKLLKNSPPKIKSILNDDQQRKKQISNILEQSKKLQGINQISKNSLIGNSSEIKQTTSNQSVIRSLAMNSQLKFDKQEEKKHKKDLFRNFKEDDIE